MTKIKKSDFLFFSQSYEMKILDFYMHNQEEYYNISDVSKHTAVGFRYTKVAMKKMATLGFFHIKYAGGIESYALFIKRHNPVVNNFMKFYEAVIKSVQKNVRRKK